MDGEGYTSREVQYRNSPYLGLTSLKKEVEDKGRKNEPVRKLLGKGKWVVGRVVKGKWEGWYRFK